MINRLYLEFELPSIYSDGTDCFQWIRRIGEYIIKEARLVSSNNFIYQRITGEYIHIYHETHLSEGAKQEYYESIGHVPAMHDPASINNYDSYNYWHYRRYYGTNCRFYRFNENSRQSPGRHLPER